MSLLVERSMSQTKVGKSSINIKYSAVNNAWLVWRDDDGYQPTVEVFNDMYEARADYNSRVEFFLSVMGV
jgi:hypothetical protein